MQDDDVVEVHSDAEPNDQGHHHSKEDHPTAPILVHPPGQGGRHEHLFLPSSLPRRRARGPAVEDKQLTQELVLQSVGFVRRRSTR